MRLTAIDTMIYAIELDFGAIWQIIDKGGTLALAVLAVVAFIRGWIAPSWAYADIKTRCEKTQEIAERATELAERTTAAASVLIDEIRQLQKHQQEESSARLLAEIKELHVKVTSRSVTLPPDEGDTT